MEEIAKNHHLLSVLSGKNSLLDSALKQIKIFETDTLNADVVLHMQPRSQYRIVLIRLIDVSEFSFYWNKNYIFYNVSRYKFLHDALRGFYLSLDPYDENLRVSASDQDFIFAREIVGFSISEY